MLHVVCWRWGTKYPVAHVKRLQSMLSRHLSVPYELVCLTDRPSDLPKGIRGVDLPKLPKGVDEFKCIRRMWLYSDKAASIGSRLLQLDLDIVIADSLDPIVTRDEDLVIWKCGSNFGEKWAYNATVMLLTPGARADVWDRWAADPAKVYRAAEAAGLGPKVNSDQAIATLLLHDRPPAVYTEADGIYAFREFAGKHGQYGRELPGNARIVSFHGASKSGPVRDPSNPQLYSLAPWIPQHWH